MAKIKSVYDHIIVKEHYDEKVGSFYIPDEYKKAASTFYGEVYSIGNKCPISHEIKEGDKVLYNRHEGVILKDGLIMLLPERILGRVDS